MLTVLCFWWDDPRAKCKGIYTYTAEHVLTLRRMVDRHLTVPHEFVCVTDRPDDVAQIVDRTVAIDRTTWIAGSRYVKLMMYRRDGADFLGQRIFYLDLDCVVTGSLDPLVDRDEDLVLWRNPNFGAPRRARYNTSILLHQTGTRPELYEAFKPDRHPAELRAEMGGTDQAWISHMVSPYEGYWDASDGIYGAGRLRDIVPGVGTKLPDDARVVFFPGSREPSMPEIQRHHPWIVEHRR